MEATIVAEVRKGMITRLRPLGCKGCGKTARKTGSSNSASKAALKKVLREALARVRDGGYPVVKLPVPIVSAREIGIPIGPIIIIIGGPTGIDFCIVITDDDGFTCVYCLFTPMPLCVGPVILN